MTSLYFLFVANPAIRFIFYPDKNQAKRMPLLSGLVPSKSI
tara:strand:- start:401 stop:523 length:123 start_codon:yes stop_codon:yes gene_type:complete